MARTTVKLSTAVLRGLKRRARAEGKSLGDVISEIVLPALASSSSRKSAAPFIWRTARMGPPKIDLEDKEALR